MMYFYVQSFTTNKLAVFATFLALSSKPPFSSMHFFKTPAS